MGVAKFLSSGNWPWPENRTHCFAVVFPQGGGHGLRDDVVDGVHYKSSGAGAGGNVWYRTIWKGSEDHLVVNIDNSGGDPEENGGDDTHITQDSTVVLKSPGGRCGVGMVGGVNPEALWDAAYYVPFFVSLPPGFGGRGGYGYENFGGGGGAAGLYEYHTGEQRDYDGENAPLPAGTDPDDPFNLHHCELRTGKGGKASTLIGLPLGGNGGDQPGGNGKRPGGGAAGTGHLGGGVWSDPASAGRACVLIFWDTGVGHTRHSSGCCCSVCDLAPKFPKTVQLHADFTAATDPDFDEDTQIVGDYTYDDGEGSCTGPSGHNATATGGSYPNNALAQDMVDVYNALDGKEMTMYNFTAGPGPEIDGEESHVCHANYIVALAPEDIDDGSLADTFTGGGTGNWIPLADHPTPSFDGPTYASFCTSGDYPTCITDNWSWWVRRGQWWLNAEASLDLARTLSEHYYFRTSAFFTGRVGSNHDTLSSAVGTVAPHFSPGWSNNDLDIAGSTIPADPFGTWHGPYDTADAALDAAKAFLFDIGPLTYVYNGAQYGFPAAFVASQPGCASCGEPLENGFWVGCAAAIVYTWTTGLGTGNLETYLTPALLGIKW